MSEWKKVKIGEITDWFSGGTPSKSNEEFWNGDIPWATAKSLVKPTISDAEIKITSKGLDAGSRIANIMNLVILICIFGSDQHKDNIYFLDAQLDQLCKE